MKLLAWILLAMAGVCPGADAVPSAARSDFNRRIVVGNFDRVVPQFVDGAGWKTTLILTNLDTKPINWVVFFIQDNGQTMNAPIVGLGPSAGVRGTLQVNASTV